MTILYCDRCKKTVKQFAKSPSRVSIKMEVDFGFQGYSFEWSDMCHTCNGLIAAEMDRIETMAKKDRGDAET